MRSKKNKKKLMIAIMLAIVVVFVMLNISSRNKAAQLKQQATIEELNKKILEAQKNQSTSGNTQGDKIKAVVAAQDIKAGDIFTQESLKLQDFSKEELPPNYFKTVAMVVGKKAGKNIAMGGFVTLAEIQVLENNVIEIPNDSRAITIPVNKFKGIASYIKVGTKVDLLMSGETPEYVAQNVRIVAFEAPPTQVVPTDPNALSKMDLSYLNAVNASAITFLIPINLVPKVLDATEKGQLQIITRNNNDEKIVIKEEELPPPPDEITLSSLPELPDAEKDSGEAPIPEPEAPKPKTREITFIKANSVETISVEDIKTISNSDKSSSDFDKKLKNLLDTLN
jgi:Flp pilus assembly protein CpaB